MKTKTSPGLPCCGPRHGRCSSARLGAPQQCSGNRSRGYDYGQYAYGRRPEAKIVKEYAPIAVRLVERLFRSEAVESRSRASRACSPMPAGLDTRELFSQHARHDGALPQGRQRQGRHGGLHRDIHAMWLRDSVRRCGLYISLANKDEHLRDAGRRYPPPIQCVGSIPMPMRS